MKNLKLIVAITAACSALISGLEAAPITYAFVNNAAYQNGYALSGSITTDGTIGALSKSNITSWNFVITNTATSTFVASASGTGATGANRLQASATQITIPNVTESLPFRYLEFDANPGILSWGRMSGSDYYLASSGSTAQSILWNNNSSSVLLNSTVDGSWIIAEVAPIPEPSTYGLLFGGFTLAVVAMRRRRSKQA